MTVRRIVSSAAAVVVAGAIGACGGTAASPTDDAIDVVASFYPLGFVAERVGGPGVRIGSLTAPGVEPHDLELSSSQIRDVVDADLVVYVGRGFQPAVDEVLTDLDDVVRLDVLEGRELLDGTETHPDEAGTEEDHPVDDEDPHAADPHVWLDPTLMASIGEDVATSLGEIDPANAERYEDNAAALRKELLALDRDMETGLRTCRSREFVTSHAAFGYLAARYDLEQVSVSGIDPEAEPSPQRLAEVARFVADNDVGVIFFEELAPPDVAEALARETGAETAVLSPLESPPRSGDYLDEMRRNLQRLQDALDCG